MGNLKSISLKPSKTFFKTSLTNSSVYGINKYISLVVLVIQFVVFSMLFLTIYNFVSSSTKETALSNMKTAAVDRSEIISNYIKSTEDTLTAYLKSEQIISMYKAVREDDGSHIGLGGIGIFTSGI